MVRRTFISWLLAGCGLIAAAQTQLDLSRYLSITNDLGSARAMAMPGAIVVMGGDPQAAIVNPAGLGLYNRHVLATTVGMYNSSLNGSILEGKAGPRPEFSDVALILRLGPPARVQSIRGPWIMAISWHKTLHYLTRLEYTPHQSVFDAWGKYMKGYEPDAFYEGTPFALTLHQGIWNIVDSNYWIYQPKAEYDSTENTTYNLYTGNGRHIFSVAVGRQLLPSLFIGGALQLPYDVMNTSERITQYYYSNGQRSYLRYEESVYSRGTGIRIGGGILWQPLCFLRMGMSVYSPALVWVKDSITAKLWDGTSSSHARDSSREAPPSLWKYQVSLPPEVRISLGIIDGAWGAFTIGWRMIPTSWVGFALWGTADPLFDSLNQQVAAWGTIHHQFSTTLELKQGPWRLRSGLRIERPTYTHFGIGGGYHTSRWYADLTLYTTSYRRVPFLPFEGWNNGLIPEFSGGIQQHIGLALSVGIQ